MRKHYVLFTGGKDSTLIFMQLIDLLDKEGYEKDSIVCVLLNTDYLVSGLDEHMEDIEKTFSLICKHKKTEEREIDDRIGFMKLSTNVKWNNLKKHTDPGRRISTGSQNRQEIALLCMVMPYILSTLDAYAENIIYHGYNGSDKNYDFDVLGDKMVKTMRDIYFTHNRCMSYDPDLQFHSTSGSFFSNVLPKIRLSCPLVPLQEEMIYYDLIVYHEFQDFIKLSTGNTKWLEDMKNEYFKKYRGDAATELL